ncbi:MAG TPA: hypothetical protein VMV25_13540 [Steroidobacteraceae bacterium]|nr:hypothetical protein [Steroidobacteraceae bacterium]
MNAAAKKIVAAKGARAHAPSAARARVRAAAAPFTAARDVRLRWPLIWTVVVAAVIYWGMHAHLERYITPQRGIGYALGIIGGSMMLLLLVYSARKRISWLRWLGALPKWFEFHMFLGVVGPVLVLFHANFRFGATNSNVALVSMLVVAASGVIGRYIYTRLHAQLDGKEDTLEQLKAVGERLRAQSVSIEFLPGLLDAIGDVEKRLIEPPKGRFARTVHLFTAAFRMARARHLVRREINMAVRRAATRDSPMVARHARRLAALARRYAYRRLDAGRRVTEYKAYARMFSWWHVLHIPLFFMLLTAGIVHVIAINLY